MELATAVIAATVALVVAILTPSLESLRQRRDALHGKFDNAIAAIFRVQAARHIASSIDRRFHSGNDEEYRLFALSMAEKSINRFVEESAAARPALAETASYVSEVGDWIRSGWELSEQNAPDQPRAMPVANNPPLCCAMAGPIGSETRMEGGVTVGWKDWFSVVGVTLDSTQTQSTQTALTIIPEPRTTPRYCFSTTTASASGLIREIN